MRDLRKYSRQTDRRLILGGILLLLVVGNGLIFAFYGKEAALLGLLCTALGLAPILMVWTILSIIDWIARKADRG
jgi:hypothetical protein